uniref:Uncharacterized protein n=1 Tax=Arundo donax TaxID=35708 RepID=A0A0A9CZW7_ARUDO
MAISENSKNRLKQYLLQLKKRVISCLLNLCMIQMTN